MRKIRITEGEYYHLYNRGVNKQNIFLDRRDYLRFLFGVLCFQFPLPAYHIPRAVTYFIRHSAPNILDKLSTQIVAARGVELIAFTLMPNHFHLIVYESREGGISRYMQRLLDAYTKYFNAKYQKSGHLFQGPFQAVHVEDNEQLLYLSAYLHQNPRELKQWRSREEKYPWSSYQDYLEQNRWGTFLKAGIIQEQFKDAEEYQKIVQESGVKEFLNEELILD